MTNDPVRLRPVEEADLALLERIDKEPRSGLTAQLIERLA